MEPAATISHRSGAAKAKGPICRPASGHSARSARRGDDAVPRPARIREEAQSNEGVATISVNFVALFTQIFSAFS
jgi:hypothetical protein